MADDSPRSARLDHVRETGELVFEAGGEQFLVTVDDSLERAILEAKQIRQESLQSNQPNTTDALPISQIQQLIRAGADPAQVAKHYSLNEALVRRFSASVQLERQYAIEQFKHVPVPKESRAHSVEELIDRTLQATRVDRDTLVWGATRQGHEPWHIIARFVSAGRKVHAEWSWNMHDNTVTCLNAAAKKLLGEHGSGTRISEPKNAGVSMETFPARLEPSHSTQTPEPTLPAARPEPVREPVKTVNKTAARTELVQPALDGTGTTDDAENRPAQAAQAAQSTQAAQAPSETSQYSHQPVQPAKNEAKAEQPTKRRSGRSAVPSWDEILFGD